MNQGSTEMMSTEHASVTKWRGEERRAERRWQREIYGKRKLDRERRGGGGEYVMKERRASNDCAAFVERGERNRRWVRFPCASTSTLLIHHRHLSL